MLAPLAQIGLGVYAFGEVFENVVSRRERRSAQFRAAAEAAAESGKPLMVVGAPDTGFMTRFFGRDYGCGDLCVDLQGCRCPRQIQGRLEAIAPRIPTASHVVYESCTLEYVDDAPLMQKHLTRIAGGPGHLFDVRLKPGSSTFWLWPGAKWRRRGALWERV